MDHPLSSRAEGQWPEVVGLVPAAGQARRLQPFPCSKELFPIGFSKDEKTGLPKPKVALEYLLEKFKAAEIKKAYLVIREGKWDIVNYFREGEHVGLSLAYLVISGSIGPPDTLDRAYPFVAQNRIAFGFPDILFGPVDGYRRLLHRQEETGADVVLGLHRVDEPRLWDMVETGEDGRVRHISMKPATTTLTDGWDFAVWTPVFSAFLHDFLRSGETRRELSRLRNTDNDPSGDLAVGVVLQAALRAGLTIQSVRFVDEPHLDIGTPENLVKAVRQHRGEAP